MAKDNWEVERRFLVSAETAEDVCRGADGYGIAQFYLSADPDRTVRVRLVSGRGGDEALMTVKGRRVAGAGPEIEFPMPTDKAEALRPMAVGRAVEKTRHRVGAWEVDVFRGALSGLVVAEIEFDPDQGEVEVPEWVGDEVTDDPRFSNARLALASHAEIAVLRDEAGIRGVPPSARRPRP